VIKAGKEEYDIPMFVNASIGRQNLKPATYPSGGPVPFVMDVWRAGAPKLDMLCPDIYYGSFSDNCARYTQSGNPLYIPETRAGDTGVANALIAFCNFNAIGFSPFGIEGRISSGETDPLTSLYNILGQLSPLILNKEAKKQMIAASVDSLTTRTTVELGNYQVELSLRNNALFSAENIGYVALIEISPNEFCVVGKNIDIQFSLKNTKEKITGILSAEEGKYENGKWIPTRRMNGDQIMVNYSFSDLYKEGKSGNGLRFGQLSVQKVKLYNY
jgi:hypothetical protein